jgi:hypothetical protein
MLVGVCSLTVPPGKVNAALEALERAPGSGSSEGELRGCWYCEIGRLNRILLIRGYKSRDALERSHEAALESGDPFGVAEVATSIELDSYAMFPGVDFLPAGRVGPMFEVRSYQLKRNGLAATFEAWSKVREARTQLSPLATVMYALSGTVPRFMHIWPYASLDERMSIRADAVANGVWPPPGGLPHIDSMQSEIYLPASFSPLQ